MNKSIPEYVNELSRSQLYRLLDLADERIKKLNDEEKVAIWQVEDRDVVLAEFKIEDYLLAIEKLKEIAINYYNNSYYSKRDLELQIRYTLIDKEGYEELFKEKL